VTADLFTLTGFKKAVTDLEGDLTAEGGPRISTMRNHNFALLVYPPAREYELRQHIHALVKRLESEQWSILSIAVHQVLFERLERELGEDELKAMADRERRLHERMPERALNDLQNTLSRHIDGPNGLAADLERLIQAFLDKHQPDPDRTLVLLGRLGALYPFFRTSALLKHLGGRTRNVPVVVLYPGKTVDGGLSFMEQLEPDRDYRPRVYA
jgi:hypothetical protein